MLEEIRLLSPDELEQLRQSLRLEHIHLFDTEPLSNEERQQLLIQAGLRASWDASEMDVYDLAVELDEALWDKQFAATSDEAWDKMIKQVRKEIREANLKSFVKANAGTDWDYDPEVGEASLESLDTEETAIKHPQ